MTDLTKIVRRVSAARRHEKSQVRRVILSLEPPAQVGVRLQGTRQTFRLDAESIYELAVRHHEQRIEKRARAIKKERPELRQASARAKARKELAKELSA